MPKHIFIGKILPERFPFYLNNPLTGAAMLFGLDMPTTFEIEIKQNQLQANVTTPQDVDLLEIKKALDHIVTSLLAAQCLETGFTYHLDIATGRALDTGREVTFYPYFEGISASPPATFDLKYHSIVRSVGEFQHAALDYRHAIELGGDTPFFCKRGGRIRLNRTQLWVSGASAGYRCGVPYSGWCAGRA